MQYRNTTPNYKNYKNLHFLWYMDVHSGILQQRKTQLMTCCSNSHNKIQSLYTTIQKWQIDKYKRRKAELGAYDKRLDFHWHAEQQAGPLGLRPDHLEALSAEMHSAVLHTQNDGELLAVILIFITVMWTHNAMNIITSWLSDQHTYILICVHTCIHTLIIQTIT